jgi:hypothetical protein
MITNVMGKFGYVGMLMWLRWIWWVVWVRLFMFVLLYWIPIHFNASIVYEDNSPSKREALYTDIVSRTDSWESTPWIFIGDFNVIHSIDEKRDGTILWSSW